MVCLLDGQINSAQDRLALVSETNVVVPDFLLERVEFYWICRFNDGVICLENLVDAFHRSQSFLDIVPSLCECFGRIDDAVKNDEVINEAGGVNGGAFFQNQHAAEPYHDGMIVVPRLLTGWANFAAWLSCEKCSAISRFAGRIVSVFFSALKALMMRVPVRVSSIWKAILPIVPALHGKDV